MSAPIPFQPKIKTELIISLHETNLDKEPAGYMIVDFKRPESEEVVVRHRLEFNGNSNTPLVFTESIIEQEAMSFFEGAITQIIYHILETQPDLSPAHKIFFDNAGNPSSIKLGNSRVAKIDPNRNADIIPISDNATDS